MNGLMGASGAVAVMSMDASGNSVSMLALVVLLIALIVFTALIMYLVCIVEEKTFYKDKRKKNNIHR